MHYILSLILLISLNAWGAELKLPALTAPVMDLAGILSESERANLSELAYEINTNNGPQITILTVPDLQEYPIEEFSIRVAEKWKLGSAEKDNGLLVVIAKAERQMRIEVGNGIEGEITDYDTAQYTKNIFPEYFKRGDYYGALRLFMEESAQKFNIKVRGGTTQRYVRRSQHNLPPINLGFIIITVIVLSIISMIFRRNAGLRGVGSGIGIAAVAGFMGLPIMIIIILFVVGMVLGLVGMGNVLAALASGGGRGGYGGGGGGGGGWSGGGGGFSGGGSSGSW